VNAHDWRSIVTDLQGIWHVCAMGIYVDIWWVCDWMAGPVMLYEGESGEWRMPQGCGDTHEFGNHTFLCEHTRFLFHAFRWPKTRHTSGFCGVVPFWLSHDRLIPLLWCCLLWLRCVSHVALFIFIWNVWQKRKRGEEKICLYATTKKL